MFLFDNLYKKISIHLKNLLTPAKYTIISLGPNCYPRTVLTRTGLIKRKKEGQKTYPFDFVWIHKAKYVTEFLNNNFENFLSELKYSNYSSSWDNGNKINFSHEAHIGVNGKKKLIKIYKKRIKNFQKEIKNGKQPFIFLQILKDTNTEEDCINTYSALKNINGKKKFVYIIVDFVNLLSDSLPFEIKAVKLELPSKNTDVFSKEFYQSDKGKEIEKKISDSIEKIVKKEFNTDMVKYK